MATIETKARRKGKLDVSPKHGGPVYGSAREIPLRLLERHPANRVPPAGNVAAIAESFAALGQLEPIHVHEVRDHGETVYQVISGECRWRAAELVGWEGLQAQVLLGKTCGNGTVDPAVDETYVLGLVAEHNGAREDLTPRQRAELGFALEAAGYTLTEAARRVGFRSHSTLSNFRRILRLPAEVVARIDLPDGDERKISQEQARAIADYADAPALVNLLVQDLDENREAWIDSLQDSVDYVIRSQTRPLTTAGDKLVWSQRGWSPHFDPESLTEDQRSELQVVKLKDGVEVACNVEAWSALQRAAGQPDNEEPSVIREPGSKAPEPSAADKREQARQRKERLANQVERWLHRWQCGWLADQLQVTSDEVQVLLGYLVLDGSMYLRQAAQIAVGTLGSIDRRQYVSPAALATGLNRAKWHDVWLAVVRSELGEPDPPHNFRLDRELIAELCSGLRWDTAANWADLQRAACRDRLESFFQLHDREQLIRLAADEFGMFADAECQKKVLVQRLLTHQTTLPCPACLLPAAKPAGKKSKKVKGAAA